MLALVLTPVSSESAFLHGLLAAILVATGRKKEANRLIKVCKKGAFSVRERLCTDSSFQKNWTIDQDMVAQGNSTPPVLQLAVGYVLSFQAHHFRSTGLQYFDK